MQKPQIFNFNNNEIRTIEMGGMPFFVGRDLVACLGYQNGSRDINRHTDEDDRTKAMLFDGTQTRETIVVNESGLYSLILSSKLPQAKEFKKWVTAEVLPTIRQHGAYLTNEALERTLMDPEYIIGIIAQMAAARKEVQMQKQIIGELKPKADYLDKILKTKSLLTITQIAKDYGLSGQRLNKLLNDKRIQYKIGDQWLLYSKYQDKGYTSSKTVYIEDVHGYRKVVMQTHWTQKGRLFLYELLKKDGVLPLAEVFE